MERIRKINATPPLNCTFARKLELYNNEDVTMQKPLNRDNILDLLREIYFPLKVIPQGADSLEDIADKFIGRFGCKDTAIPTWLEGQVQELIEQLKRVNHHTVSEEIWRVEELKRKLTGEGK